MKMYIKGGKGIESPTDADGKKIEVGDKLSWDYVDGNKQPMEWMLRPIFEVKFNKEKGFYFAAGIEKDLYLHDFRFKYTRIV